MQIGSDRTGRSTDARFTDADGLSDQLDTTGRSTSFLKADADIRSLSGYFLDPSDIGDDSPPINYELPLCMDKAATVRGEFHRKRI